jgi:anti-anti-sigma factor
MGHWKNLEIERHDRAEPRATVWRFTGALTGGKEGYAFLDELRAQIRERPGGVVINLSRVEHITSAGVGVLAAAYTSAVNAGARMMLASVPKQVEAVLSIVNLLSVIEHDPTEEGALSRLSA